MRWSQFQLAGHRKVLASLRVHIFSAHITQFEADSMMDDLRGIEQPCAVTRSMMRALGSIANGAIASGPESNDGN